MNHTAIRLCAALLLIGLGLFWHKPAEAAVSCNASMTSIDFGTVDPQSSQTNANATFNYSCTNPPGNGTVYVTLCFSIGDGTQGQGNSNPRQMLDPNGNPLQFQLYQDSTYTTVWGSSFFGVNSPVVVKLKIKNNKTESGSASMYGQVLANQTTAVPNPLYQDQFGGNHTAVTVNESSFFYPASCSTNIVGSFPFSVKAAVQNKCTVTASTLDFGTPAGVLTSAVPATTTISVQCAAGTNYNVGLGGGLNSGNDINARKMVLGANSIAYQLYQDAGHSTVWGDSVGTNTVAGTGDGTVQNLTVYGQVPAQPTPPAGTYQDTVVVSVTY